ncbi:hypothetical protein ELH55_34220 (plasmid) [Rhizobium ruizarguesonis]|uniref:hypothetical protein n=1 Tax=Rhizobium ruizarguesonis TaxID=2081791 RepID=UPI00103070EF|nr:hypothetical protein [Rhizobium ruizarguesonis]TBA94346.1 hypothetical protein ELH55_34220 [Rhizobium ruizarguesonis]
MSILSSTQGTPERVWSLVSIIAAGDGELERSEASDWLNPGYMKDQQKIVEKGEAFGQVLGAATALGAVQAEGKLLRLHPTCPTTDIAAFADWCHEQLCSLASDQKDAVILETYAWVASRSLELRETRWFGVMSRDEFADAAARALPDGKDDDGDRRINTSKLASWRRWLRFFGLMEELPLPVARSQPSSTLRLAKEISRSSLPRETVIPADDFLAAFRTTMPYLDGGQMFAEYMRRQGINAAPKTLSPILSSALRDLHDAGTIELKTLGDLSSYVRMTGDSKHGVSDFYAVEIRGALQ